MAKNNRKTRKDKGNHALFFPKWYLCTKRTPIRSQTPNKPRFMQKAGGKLK